MQYVASPFDIKTLSEGGQIEGILAGFGNVDRMDEVLAAGCFSKSLAERPTPLPMLLHHDLHRPIGAWKQWQDRADGLFVQGIITLEAKDGQEAYALAKNGALTGLSVGYRVKRSSTDPRTGLKTIHEAELWEGSLVSVPANPRTNVTAVKAIGSPRDIAELLQEAGLSSRKAKVAAGAAWKAINSNDEDAVDPELLALVKASAARIAKGGRQSWN